MDYLSIFMEGGFEVCEGGVLLISHQFHMSR